MKYDDLTIVKVEIIPFISVDIENSTHRIPKSRM